LNDFNGMFAWSGLVSIAYFKYWHWNLSYNVGTSRRDWDFSSRIPDDRSLFLNSLQNYIVPVG
jgi:hypothetical protein